MTGKFQKGNRLGRGGSVQQRKSLTLRSALLHSITPETIVKIMAAQVRLALDGDTVAAKFVMDYTVGRPKTQIELTGLHDAPLLSAHDSLAVLREVYGRATCTPAN